MYEGRCNVLVVGVLSHFEYCDLLQVFIPYVLLNEEWTKSGSKIHRISIGLLST